MDCIYGFYRYITTRMEDQMEKNMDMKWKLDVMRIA